MKVLTKNISCILIFLSAFLCNFCSADFIMKSENCTGRDGNPLNCPSNFIYYFECCANECCLRTQILPAFVIGLVACVMTVFCVTSCVAWCCCGE